MARAIVTLAPAPGVGFGGTWATASHSSTVERFCSIQAAAWERTFSSLSSPRLYRTFCRATSTGLMVNSSNRAAAAGLAARKSLLATTRMSAASQPRLHGAAEHWPSPRMEGPSTWVGETDSSEVESQTALSPGRRSPT